MIIRERKIINGMVVEVERDTAADEVIRRFSVAGKVQARLGFSLDSRNASTMGAGKNTGNMAKANAAKSYVGACSRKTWRDRQRKAAQAVLSQAA